MQLNSVQPNTKRKNVQRVGRGGKRGKTSGRGHKGQKARAGHRIRPAERDRIKKIPKLRGHGKNRPRTVNPDRVRPEVVNLSVLEANFASADQVSPVTLLQKGLVRRHKGRTPSVKVLGTGTLSKKLTIAGCAVSASAREGIVKAGGEVL
jgi:large subunit ribosomal protein L15